MWERSEGGLGQMEGLRGHGGREARLTTHELTTGASTAKVNLHISIFKAGIMDFRRDLMK